MYKSNKKEPLWFFTKVVAQAGIEPATHGFSVESCIISNIAVKYLYVDF